MHIIQDHRHTIPQPDLGIKVRKRERRDWWVWGFFCVVGNVSTYAICWLCVEKETNHRKWLIIYSYIRSLYSDWLRVGGLSASMLSITMERITRQVSSLTVHQTFCNTRIRHKTGDKNELIIIKS